MPILISDCVARLTICATWTGLLLTLGGKSFAVRGKEAGSAGLGEDPERGFCAGVAAADWLLAVTGIVVVTAGVEAGESGAETAFGMTLLGSVLETDCAGFVWARDGTDGSFLIAVGSFETEPCSEGIPPTFSFVGESIVVDEMFGFGVDGVELHSEPVLA
ncbi:MAG TPA: hypothetical protein VMX38_02185 [Verrucomicrobiae bacterium]|jgi:hypothetical protein|nr:hypothetical protein [Verrucomicrobiae bacterium]